MTESAFTSLINEIRPASLRILTSMLRDREDAQDAFQDGALRIWKFADQFRGEADIKTWAYHIVRMAGVSMIRHKNAKCRRGESVAVEVRCGLIPDGTNIERDLINREREKAVRKAACSLRGPVRRAIDATLNDALPCPIPNAIKLNKLRGILRLRVILGHGRTA